MGNLAKLMASQRCLELLKVKCLLDTARGMNVIHHSAIIHRDLKPDNILVSLSVLSS